MKGSNKYRKLQKKIAKLYEKVVNQRNNFLHKLSKKIIGDNQAVIVEDLNIKGLLQNGNLSKHIADASWRKFISYLEYKAKLYGRKLIKISPFYPSSRLCSVCGYKNENLKLSDREWKCPDCGTEHDRDYAERGIKTFQGIAHLTSGRGGTPRTYARGECGCTR